MTPVPDEKFETDFEIETGPFQLIHNFMAFFHFLSLQNGEKNVKLKKNLLNIFCFS